MHIGRWKLQATKCMHSQNKKMSWFDKSQSPNFRVTTKGNLRLEQRICCKFNRDNGAVSCILRYWVRYDYLMKGIAAKGDFRQASHTIQKTWPIMYSTLQHIIELSHTFSVLLYRQKFGRVCFWEKKTTTHICIQMCTSESVWQKLWMLTNGSFPS